MAKKVKAIPEGYRTLTPFLVVNDGSQAIKFYKEAFGAQEMEKHTTPDGKVMHAVLKIGDSLFMLADEFSNSGCGVSSPASLKSTTCMFHLYVEDVDSSFNQAVKAGAKVNMPLEDTFWGDRYGQVIDPFGHSWSLATHKADFTKEEIEKKGSEVLKEKLSKKKAYA